MIEHIAIGVSAGSAFSLSRRHELV
jgi:hypothetical protein